MRNINLSIYLMHQDDCLSNFYEDYMSSLSTIYHYASLALQRNFLLLCFLLQLSWKEYPPWHIKEFHHHLNHDLIYTVYWNFNKKLTMRKGVVNFCFEIVSISILPLICSLNNSNLFLMEFMFKWANINLLAVSLPENFRVLSQKLRCSEWYIIIWYITTILNIVTNH